MAKYYVTNFPSQKEEKLTEESVKDKPTEESVIEKGENLFLEDYHDAESS